MNFENIACLSCTRRLFLYHGVRREFERNLQLRCHFTSPYIGIQTHHAGIILEYEHKGEGGQKTIDLLDLNRQ